MLHKLRFFWVLVRALLARRKADVSHTVWRCRWLDCDINRHMNNATYLSMMDLGRWDLLLRTGLMRATFELKTFPVVVELKIQYKREIPPGLKYTLETEALPLDGRRFVFRQRFVAGDTVHAVADVVTLFLHGGKVADQGRVAAVLMRADQARLLPEP